MNGLQMDFLLKPIATIVSPFKEKFATPRQAGLTPTAHAEIVFLPEFATPEAVRGLEEFSHLWLLFIFHHNLDSGWQATVRPPRLGGNRRVGVYASRSPFRPNPVGMSAVRLLDIDISQGRVSLQVQGADLVDGTPIIDIKPYIPYSDSLPAASGGFASSAPSQLLDVVFSDLATDQLQRFQQASPNLADLIRETLSLDPRPAYRRNSNDSKEYGIWLDRYNIRWQFDSNRILVTSIDVHPHTQEHGD